LPGENDSLGEDLSGAPTRCGRIFDLDFRVSVSHHFATLKLVAGFKSAH